MKRIAYSFLLIVLFSCGRVPTESRSRIVIEYRDSTREYFLLAVRERSLLVTPYNPSWSTLDTLYSTAFTVEFTDVQAIYKKSRASTSDILFPALLGCIGGGLGGFAIGAPNWFTDNTSFIAPIVIGMFGGIFIGSGIGILTNDEYKRFFLDSKEHISEVRNHATYVDHEPPELQTIK